MFTLIEQGLLSSQSKTRIAKGRGPDLASQLAHPSSKYEIPHKCERKYK